MDHGRETFLPEDDVFQVKGILDDAGCGHSDTKHVLLRGHKRRHGNPVNVTQVTVTLENNALRFILEKGGASHSREVTPTWSNPHSDSWVPSMTLRASSPTTVLETV